VNSDVFDSPPDVVFEALHGAVVASGSTLTGADARTRTVFFKRGRSNKSVTATEGSDGTVLVGSSEGLHELVATEIERMAASPHATPGVSSNETRTTYLERRDAESRLQALAKEKLAYQMGVKKELRNLLDLLYEQELVVNLARGSYDGKQGLVVVTDRRVLFLSEGIGRHKLEDFPYDKVTSVQSEKGMVNGGLKIFASGNAAVIEAMYPKERAPEIGDYVRSRLHKAPESVAPVAESVPPDAVTNDPMEQIRKLGELRDAGLITPDEFEQKKRELLERI
jgi:PH (Pleckstrin Homology) domain-containing protein/putative oligomerization/nucleic acid binding protein